MGRVRVSRVEDAGIVVLPVQCGHVVAGDGPPVDFTRGSVCPALDAGKQTFNTWAVAMDNVARDVCVVLESSAVRLEKRNQIFRPGEDIDIGLLGVPILGQTLVGLTCDRGQRQIPSEAEGAVAGARIVGER